MSCRSRESKLPYAPSIDIRTDTLYNIAPVMNIEGILIYTNLPLPERRGSWLEGSKAAGHYCADSSCRTVPPPELLMLLEHVVLTQVLLAACQPLLQRMAETIFGKSNSINVGSYLSRSEEGVYVFWSGVDGAPIYAWNSFYGRAHRERSIAVQLYGVYALYFQSWRCGLRIRGSCLGLEESISTTRHDVGRVIGCS